MANRRISEFPSINGADIVNDDLMTLVHVFEVDPLLRNKKITFTQFRAYLDQYYANLTGDTISGNFTVEGNLTVSGTTIFNTVSTTNLGTFSGVFVQNDLNVSGTTSGVTFTGTTVNAVSGRFTTRVSGATITGTTVQATTGNYQSITGATGNFTVRVSGASITGTTGAFTTLTGQTISGANITGVSGTFTTQLSGATVTGVSGQFTNITGGTLNTTTGTAQVLTVGSEFVTNADRIRIATANTPASAAATGTSGQISWDTNYIYVCTATNTWKRTAISSW